MGTFDHQADDFIFITTGGGTFFPRNCLNDKVLNSEVFLSVCPHAYDVCFKAMSL
jgi:hypothetical protein